MTGFRPATSGGPKPVPRNRKPLNQTPPSDEQRPWWHFGLTTWLLILGLIIINAGIFVHPELLDAIATRSRRFLDIRLWPWWYLLFLALLVTFSIKWFFIYRNWEDYDELEAEAARRFNRMAVTLSIVMGILVLLNATRLIHFIYHPLMRWFGYGDFTWFALLSFTLMFCVIVPVIYFVKEWLVTFVNP